MNKKNGTKQEINLISLIERYHDEDSCRWNIPVYDRGGHFSTGSRQEKSRSLPVQSPSDQRTTDLVWA